MLEPAEFEENNMNPQATLSLFLEIALGFSRPDKLEKHCLAMMLP